MFSDYSAALRWLYGTQLTGIKLGLEPMRRLLDALGWEPGNTRFLHVAGTNGKGSVCAMLDSICRAAGRRTGLFTSPHLVTFRERIRLDGEMIPETDVTAGLSRLSALTSGWETPPTFFELTTALALDWFRRSGAEIVVLETGLGGRLDATNVLQRPAVCVVTAIAMDHIAYLGDTLAAIAGEKAGILKPGVPAVVAPQVPEVAEVLARRAAEVGVSSLRFITAPVSDDWRVNLAGSHQRLNAALALAALDAAAGLAVDETAARRGLETVVWPGRFERFEKDDRVVILDGAHNPHAAERLAQTWREEFGKRRNGDTERATVVFGTLADKDAAGMTAALAPVAARFIAAPVRSSPRAAGPDALRETLATMRPAVSYEVAVDVRKALALARRYPERVLVTGSLFLVGEARAWLTGQATPETSWQ